MRRVRRDWAAALAGWAIFVLGVMVGAIVFARVLAAVVEAPPPGMVARPDQMDPAYERQVGLDELARLCPPPPPQRDFGGRIRRRFVTLGCFVSDSGLIYLPRGWPSQRELQEIRVHEWAHKLFGWRHGQPANP